MLQAVTSRYLAMVIGFITSMVLARVLLPKEIGLYSVAAAVLAVAHVLRDFGVTSYLIREPDLTQSKVNTCFTVSLCIAWVFGVIVLSSAQSIANVYNEPQLAPMLTILSVTLFVVPFNSVRYALLRRDQHARILFIAELGSAFANASVATTLAVIGIGPESLAWGILASIVATGVIVQFGRGTFRVGRPTLADARSVVGFGGKALGLNLISRLNAIAPGLITGKLLGMHDAAILSRADSTADIFGRVAAQSIGQVVYAETARQFREGGALGASYTKSVVYLSALAMPCYGFVILLALPIVRILFGPNWDESASVLRMLGVAGMAAPFILFLGNFLTAIGRIDIQLRIEAISTPLKICVWLAAAPAGLMVAVNLGVLVHLLAALASTFLISRLLEVRVVTLTRAWLHGLLVTGITLSVPTVAVLLEADKHFGELVTVGACVVAAVICWLAALFWTAHPFRHELVLLARSIRQ